MSFVAQRLAVLWARLISKTTAHVIWHVAYSVGQPTHSSHQSLINYTPSHPALIHPQTRTSLTQPPAHPHTISLITITHSFTLTSHTHSHDVTLSHKHHSPSHLLTQTLSHLSLSPTHLPTHHPFTLMMLLSLTLITHPATCSPTHYLTYHYHSLIYPHITRSLS